MKMICIFALVAVTMVACVQPPEESAAVDQAISGGLSLSMSTSDRDKKSSDSAAKLYIHGVKGGTILPQSVTVIVGNYSSGSNARTYDVDIDISLRCPGLGPTIPPHTVSFFVSLALDSGEAHYMTDLACDTFVSEKGFSVLAQIHFDQWECNALSCN